MPRGVAALSKHRVFVPRRTIGVPSPPPPPAPLSPQPTSLLTHTLDGTRRADGASASASAPALGRLLTHPGDPVANGGRDNEHSDLIMRVGDVLTNDRGRQ